MSEAKIALAELKEGQSIDSPLMIVQKEIRQSKHGMPYLHLILRDASGTITAFMWDNFQELAPGLHVGEVMNVRGRVQKYRNSLQIIVHKLESLPPDAHVSQDFMPASDVSVDQMFTELMEMVDTVNDPHVKALIRMILSDVSIEQAFKQAPAAKVLHHSYIGGLLEHSLSLARLADLVCRHYARLDRDLLLSGTILHDVGKIEELSNEAWLDYSRKGRLIGHITLGVLIVEKYAREIEGFPEEKKEKLQHMILSHHGEYEFGSPRRPKLREALVLHFLDNMDSHLNGFDLALKDQQNNDVAFSRILDRFIYDS